MDAQKILKFCLEKGFLVDKEVLNLFSETSDLESLGLIVEKIKSHTQKRIITKQTFCENQDKVNEVFLSLPEKKQESLEKLKIKLGLSIEISHEKRVAFEENVPEEDVCQVNPFSGVKILSNPIQPNKKIEVKDFVLHFKNRFSELSNILQQHSELSNLVSINKISGNRQGISIIGIVSDKKITKNKNILFEVEDLTGKIKVLINQNKPELYKKAEEISLDSVIGFKGSGNREIFFVNDVIFPDSKIFERKNSFVEEYALFIGDLHFGSKLFLKENFLKFIDYLNGKVPNTLEVDKIKYLFIVGDLITGVGNYPNQERDLKIVDLEEQFSGIAELLGKIRKDIKIIISPGNHDCVRLMEPQPVFDEKYAWPLYDLDNVLLTGNPCNVNIGAKKGFLGFNVLTYHGFSFPFYANNVSRLMLKKSMNSPEEIMKYLLKNRHLAPTHASVQYFPLEKDALLIREVPDIFVAAHTHKSAVSYYDNVLVVSTSCWESMTPYQEKFGNKPDHCKVPLFNLKTRSVKILDFE
ncbi:metallophosphoesterase [Candidatus Pacearchaeota archaeon]|nr:metallophosphoesterase [Candidatus Pacearchaeota archaeon]